MASMPLSLVFDPDSFYFGVLPVPAKAAGAMGVPSVSGASAMCREEIRIISNMGAANPRGAAVTGDDVLETIRKGDFSYVENGEPVAAMAGRLVSANAYLGAEPIVRALAAGANIVLTGRVADPALFLAPMMHEFGWTGNDWAQLGQGTVLGHLLECAGQATGGYFADPGLKDVPNLASLGFPIAEVAADGSAIITKVEGSGVRTWSEW